MAPRTCAKLVSDAWLRDFPGIESTIAALAASVWERTFQVVPIPNLASGQRLLALPGGTRMPFTVSICWRFLESPMLRVSSACVALAVWIGAAGVAVAQNTGNIRFKDPGVAVASQPEQQEHTTDEMIEFVEDYIDPQLAAVLRAATDPQTGTIRVVELFWPRGRGGYADAGTIAVSTRGRPLWECAIILMHEFVHAQHAQACDPGNPDAGDCATDSTTQPSCGACEHAAMGGEDVEHLGIVGCEWFAIVAPEELASVCAVVRAKWRDAEQRLKECAEDGCPPSQIPSIYAIILVPPCCD